MDENGGLKIAFAAYVLLTLGIVVLGIGSIINGSTFLLSLEISMVVMSLGSTMISISIISIVYEHVMKNSLIKAIKNKLSDSLDEKFATINKLEKSGISNAYESFPFEEIKTKFRESKKSIRILQTWVPESTHLISQIESALKNGCEVKILLLKPGSDQAICRNNDLGYEDQIVCSKINNAIHDFYMSFKDSFYGKNFHINLYEGTPTMAIYAADDVAYVGLYCRGSDSAKGAHFEISRENTFFYDTISKHFDSVWNESKTYKSHNQ